VITPEQAQASLEREREAYWKRRNAPPPEPEPDMRPISGLGNLLGGGGSNRASARASGRYKGVSRSQVAGPSRPTFEQVRVYMARQMREMKKGLEK
jgi:hypothetical protein